MNNTSLKIAGQGGCDRLKDLGIEELETRQEMGYLTMVLLEIFSNLKLENWFKFKF